MVCWLELHAFFLNVPVGEYSVFWKVLLGDGADWSRALDGCHVEVSVKNNDGTRTLIAYNEDIAFDRRFSDFQLLHGPDFVLDIPGINNYELDVQLYECKTGQWKTDVYFSSVILIPKNKVVPELTLKDIAYKSLISNEPSIDDIEIAMQSIMPIRNIATFSQSDDVELVYHNCDYVDPTVSHGAFSTNLSNGFDHWNQSESESD